MSLKPLKDFHLSIFFKDGRPCMMIESNSKSESNLQKLESLEKKIRDWFQ